MALCKTPSSIIRADSQNQRPKSPQFPPVFKPKTAISQNSMFTKNNKLAHMIDLPSIQMRMFSKRQSQKRNFRSPVLIKKR